ncbi:(4Fe-4S)-binding protein [Sphingobacterium sp. N143]|uniref:(4Fe-4S)-binding protein n=1 Tax=Sphingobacterium sp. N143 TaxID=2746727 RepID=UPI002577CDDC|nr:(4Fe-4S)-binding protein [Sphingobacterium sp. N143]MDM1295083.1 (4Fe-4S)-binding protein [Sphingobacterium sp. N143]
MILKRGLFLPTVYHPKDRPWITVQHAITAELIDQIQRCPSGALQYELKMP